MDLIIIGGGCYGCYHTRQLLKAHSRGRIAAHRLRVVDHNPTCRARQEFASEQLVDVVQADWADFLRDYLAQAVPETDDRLVPAPFAPHLLFDWLLDVAREDAPQAHARRARCELTLELPFERGDDTGNRFISAAGWLCPATCIEPARCPAIRSERTWELGDIVRARAARAPQPYADVEVLTCRHFAFGIGTIPVADLVQARRHLAAALRRPPENAGQQRALIGTVSSCHGVLGEMAFIHPAGNAPAPAGDQRHS
jgi:hypothetical protein